MLNWGFDPEFEKVDLHYVQLNRLYDNFIKELLDEIPGVSNNSLGQKFASLARNKDKYTEEEIVLIFKNNKYIDYSPWFTDDYPYKVFIILSYYEWREYFKQNKLLVNPVTGQLIDEDLPHKRIKKD